MLHRNLKSKNKAKKERKESQTKIHIVMIYLTSLNFVSPPFKQGFWVLGASGGVGEGGGGWVGHLSFPYYTFKSSHH